MNGNLGEEVDESKLSAIEARNDEECARFQEYELTIMDAIACLENSVVSSQPGGAVHLPRDEEGTVACAADVLPGDLDIILIGMREGQRESRTYTSSLLE